MPVAARSSDVQPVRAAPAAELGTPVEVGSRFHHVGALDGLRGLAFLTVLAYHLMPSRLPAAGHVGVDLFFALSGFLITVLLRSEQARSGRVSLRRFAGRRARRLFPALVAFLTAYLVLLALFGRQPWFGGVPGISGAAPPLSLAAGLHSAAGAVTYMLNLGIAYHWGWATGAPIGHLWSLSVEGQFYALWGPLVALMLSRRRLASWALPATIALGAGSVTATALLWHGGAGAGLVYFASFTRAQALLAGAAAGFAWRPGAFAGRRRRRAASAVATVSAGWLAVAVFAAGRPLPTWAATVELAMISVAAACLVLVVASPPTGRAAGGWFLGSAALRYVGRRSYALYLWHYVVLAWFRDEGALGSLLAVGISFALAEASWRLVERPAARWHRGRRTAGRAPEAVRR